MPPPTVCIVGGETVLGRELREQLTDGRFPAHVVALGVDDEISGVLSADAGEAVFLPNAEARQIEDATAVFCAGSPATTLKAYELVKAQRNAPAFIDLTGALEDIPGAHLRSPMVELAASTGAAALIQVVAHPAATMLALLLTRLSRALPVRHAVANVFEPASERGQAGINELQRQTASLLSFQQMPKDVFDAQSSFNMLPRYGEAAPERLEAIEQRIDRHLATLLAASGSRAKLPSLRLSQAPVFHGYSASLWVDCERRPELDAVAEALASAQIEVRDADLEPPTNVGAAGQSGVTAGLIEADRNHASAVWIWAAADNFRITVDSAVQIARALLPGSEG